MRKAALILLTTLSAFAAELPAREASLRGSHASLVRQREMAEEYGLPAVRDAAHREELIRAGVLLPIPTNDLFNIDPRLKPEKRFLLRFVIQFLHDLMLEARKAGFDIRHQMNSALRTVVQQRGLKTEGNWNAAAVELAAHTRGTTFDLARFVLVGEKQVWYPAAYTKWLERRLLELEEAGLIEFSREEVQRVYHITVSPKYGQPQPSPEEFPPTTIVLAEGKSCSEYLSGVPTSPRFQEGTAISALPAGTQ
jgi:hypothetical protein